MSDLPSKCDLCGSPEVYEVNRRTCRDFSFSYTIGYCYPCARLLGKIRIAVRDHIGYYPNPDSRHRSKEGEE